MWVIESLIGPVFSKVPQEQRGHFYSNNCYMLIYTQLDSESNRNYTIYFWEGNLRKF